MTDVAQRQQWMAILAKASLPQLEDCVATLSPLPAFEYLRPPEIGLAMVRGRAGGTGQPFNLGEMTLTRCVVQLPESAPVIAGFGYVAGRSRRHAELAALCDALLQQPQWQPVVQRQVLAPLQAAAQQQQAQRSQQVAATQVNFFTMQRGQ